MYDFFLTLSQEWDILIESRALFLLLTALFCGALIGAEREYAAKPAGLRTNLMICVGSALFTIASVFSWTHIAGESPHLVRRSRWSSHRTGFSPAWIPSLSSWNNHSVHTRRNRTVLLQALPTRRGTIKKQPPIRAALRVSSDFFFLKPLLNYFLPSRIWTSSISMT